jgi:CheY-like chemotaxis protein
MNGFPVLYVEDEESDVLLLRLAFEKAGIRNPIHSVGDGKAATDYLAGNTPYSDRTQYPLPGLVLLDLNLPYWSGFEVLAWLRQQEALPRLPVLILSSSSRQDDVTRAYEAGANAYLVKPNSFTEFATLATAIRDFWLEQSLTPESAGTDPTPPSF